MAIDPGLYKKYTGRTPGDAMIRMGESLAQDARRERGGDTSTLGAIVRGRKIMRLVIALGVLVALVAVLAGARIF
jgi:hypothetical protein